MFTSYFKTAWRNLSHNKAYTLINIAGLGIGIGVCLLIFVIIQFQSGFNEFHSKKDRIYRVLTEFHHSDSKDIFYGKGVPAGVPRGIKTNLAHLQKVAAIFADHNDQVMVLSDNEEPVKKFKEENGVFFTEPSFFDIFDFPLLAGSYESLKDPNNALVAKETAEKYFGDWRSAIGKTIRLNSSYLIKISGVLATIPSNTNLQLKLVVAYGTAYTKSYTTSTEWDATGSAFGCYVLLSPDITQAAFNQQLRAYSRKAKSPENKDSHIIQALRDWHFDTQVGDYSNKTVSRQLIYALWLIAGFILLIACVNFINLSTAQAVNRAKEVGIRKVLGSNKLQLKLQFITETFLMVLFSVVVAMMIAYASLSSVNKILELSLAIDVLVNTPLLVFLLVITIAVTLLAGFYPSVVLSGFNPINALKSKIVAKSTSGISLRRSLVVFQFVIAQALIIGTLIIIKQMHYFNTQPLGFDKDAIVNIPFLNDSIGTSKVGYLKKQLTVLKGVQNVSFSSNTPIEDNNDNWSKFKFDHATKQTDFYAILKFADNQYIPTYQLQLVAGRNLYASDTAREFLVNENLLKNLGIQDPQVAIGKEISLWDGKMYGTIAGVMKDFNDRSFRSGLAPLLVTTIKDGYSQAGLKLSQSDLPSTLDAIRKIWNQTFPDYVFEFTFLDEKVGSFYKQEAQLASLYKIFAAIAIFLSCLGLYGLASFMAAQRTKEVGIRKVLGATVANIMYLFSKEFVLLISLAFLIATPLAWYYMNQWLQNYPYQIKMSWWIFVAGGAGSVIIALITVSYHAIRAALADPVRSLRSE